MTMTMSKTLALLLVLAHRPYFSETIDHLPHTRHRHVAVSGKVTVVRHESDGDIHIRVVDTHGHFVICEVVPYHPLPLPKVGQLVTMRGIAGFDPGHGWWELNPVEEWEVWRVAQHSQNGSRVP